MREKIVGKKIVGKKCEKLFLHSLEYRDQKMVGKYARNNFSRNSRIVRKKNVEKNSRKKVRKTFFNIHTKSRPKKGGE